MTDQPVGLELAKASGETGELLGDPDRYRIPHEESSRLVKELLDSRTIDTTKKIVCYEIEGDCEISDCARTLEAEVFEARFDEGPDEMAAFYGRYEDSSRFFVSVNRDTGEMVGVLRAIEDSKEGLMTLNIVSKDERFSHLLDVSPEQVLLKAPFNQEIDLVSSWDIGTVGVPKRHREAHGKIISTQLYRSMYKSALNHDIDYLFSIIDTRPLTVMKSYLGIPFENITEPFNIGGSKESIAVVGYVPDFYSKMRNKKLGITALLAFGSRRALIKGTRDDAISLLPCQK